MTGRPKGDSPDWTGPLWEIDVPDVDHPERYILFHLATSQDSHDRMVKGLIENGHTDFKVRKIDPLE